MNGCERVEDREVRWYECWQWCGEACVGPEEEKSPAPAFSCLVCVFAPFVSHKFELLVCKPQNILVGGPRLRKFQSKQQT